MSVFCFTKVQKFLDIVRFWEKCFRYERLRWLEKNFLGGCKSEEIYFICCCDCKKVMRRFTSKIGRVYDDCIVTGRFVLFDNNS